MYRELMRRLPVFLVCGVAVFVTSCRRNPADTLLEAFPAAVSLSPVDSVLLEENYSVFSPEGVVVRGDRMVVLHTDGDAVLSLIGPDGRTPVFRKGRGPKELLDPTSLILDGDRLKLYDGMSLMYFSAEMDALGTDGFRVDTLVRIRNAGQDGYCTAKYVYSKGASFVAAGYQPGYWYSLIAPDGRILDGVEYVRFPGKEDFSVNENYVLHLNSYAALHPDGDRGVCVMSGAAVISLFEIRGNALQEYCRKVFSSPQVEGSRDPGLPVLRHLPESTRAFQAVAADEKHIYALYSGGRVVQGVRPAEECTHLLVFDWSGEAVRHYELEASINAFHVEDGCVWGVSKYPGSRLYVYQLDQ